MSNNLERVLRLMAEKTASDVYLSANTPILIKIHGQIMQLSDQLISHTQTRQLLAELLTPQQMEGLLTSYYEFHFLYVNGVGSFIPVTVTGISDGVYTATFTPTAVGAWQLVIRQALYAPRGYEETFDVTETGPDMFTRMIDGYSFFQEMELIGAVLCGKVSGGPGTPVFRSMDDTANRVAAICDAVGNRSVVTLTP